MNLKVDTHTITYTNIKYSRVFQTDMSYIRDRLIQAAVTLYAIVTLGFLINKLLPGGPVDFLQQDIRENPQNYGLPQRPRPQQVQRTIERLVEVSPNKPLHEAYIDYIIQVFFHFDLGESIIVANNVPVTQLVLSRAPWTIFISTIGLLYGLIIGIILGSLMAYYEGSKFDIGMTIGNLVSGAIPYYVVAIGLLYFAAFQWGWFPTGGRVNPDATPGINWPYISSIFYHAALPAFSVIIPGFGGRALGLRANSIRLLGEEYIRVAELRGLSRYRISIAYLARNAILPMWTSIVIGLGSLLGGSVILEQIFQYPGMGMLMFDAAISRDFPLLMGVFIIISFIFVIGTLLADFTYSLIDPRADVKVSR
jgi:peptide/nickel transport system permease protein